MRIPLLISLCRHSLFLFKDAAALIKGSHHTMDAGTGKFIYTVMRAHLTGITRDQLITALYLQSSFSAMRNRPGGTHSLCMHAAAASYLCGESLCSVLRGGWAEEP
jgi:hypothetical protein